MAEEDSSRDPARARLAARNPDRPGELCKAEPASWRPVVDRFRCEGKSDCVAVCPYDVFELGTIADADFAALGFLGKLKSLAHGKKTALLPRIDACKACGLCVVACPEEALVLERLPSSGPSA